MSRIKPGKMFAVLALVVALAGMGAIVAEEVRESRTKMSWTVVGDDGTPHTETIEIDGPRPFLGVELGREPDGGARIEAVIEDSPAESAGLREGDIVVGYDGREIESTWDLTRAVLKTQPGERVDIEVLRDGSRRTIRAEIGENDDWVGAFAFGGGDWSFDADALQERMERIGEMEFFDSEAFEQHMEKLNDAMENMEFNFDFDFQPGQNYAWAFRSGRPRLGVQLVDVTGDLREHLGSNRDEGVLVGKVLPDTPAEFAGVAVGDLIVAVDGEAVENNGDLIRLLSERDGERFDLEVIRDGRPLSLGVSLPERDDPDFEPGHLRRHEHLGDRHSADRT